jgi:hypothetical protein
MELPDIPAMAIREGRDTGWVDALRGFSAQDAERLELNLSSAPVSSAKPISPFSSTSCPITGFISLSSGLSYPMPKSSMRGGIRSIAVFPIIGSISPRGRRLVMIWPIWGNIMPIMCG